MAEVERTYFVCDRCHLEVSSADRPKRPDGSPKVHLMYNEEYSIGPGMKFNWVDMCPECEREVHLMLDGMLRSAKVKREVVKNG